MRDKGGRPSLYTDAQWEWVRKRLIDGYTAIVSLLLVDVANFAMLEFLYPAFTDAHYTPTDSDQSPGLAGGISYKELMEGDYAET